MVILDYYWHCIQELLLPSRNSWDQTPLGSVQGQHPASYPIIPMEQCVILKVNTINIDHQPSLTIHIEKVEIYEGKKMTLLKLQDKVKRN